MTRLGAYFAILGLSFASGPAAVVEAGEFGRRSVSRYMDWDPTDCFKPSQPYFSCYDNFSCQSAIDEFNSYVGEVSSYLDCIVSEAESDIKNTKNAIIDGHDEAQTDAKNELEAARNDLESAIQSAGFNLR